MLACHATRQGLRILSVVRRSNLSGQAVVAEGCPAACMAGSRLRPLSGMPDVLVAQPRASASVRLSLRWGSTPGVYH
jgi:hypothetical protein